VLVIPGEPLLGIFKQLRGVFLKRRQVVEWVDVVKSASVNEAHEQIPDVSPVFGPKEQTILAMLNRPLKHLLTEVIIQWGPWNSQKEGQRFPMVEHIGDSLSHGGVWLDLSFIQLFLRNKLRKKVYTLGLD
jgi:hypothetical protein